MVLAINTLCDLSIEERKGNKKDKGNCTKVRVGILAKLLKELETRRETFQRLGVGGGVVGA